MTDIEECKESIKQLRSDTERALDDIAKRVDKIYPMITGEQNGDVVSYKLLNRTVTRLVSLIDGDASLSIVGIREQQKEMSENIKAMLEDKKKREYITKGIMVGIGLNAVVGIGTLGTVIANILGAFK